MVVPLFSAGAQLAERASRTHGALWTPVRQDWPIDKERVVGWLTVDLRASSTGLLASAHETWSSSDPALVRVAAAGAH